MIFATERHQHIDHEQYLENVLIDQSIFTLRVTRVMCYVTPATITPHNKNTPAVPALSGLYVICMKVNLLVSFKLTLRSKQCNEGNPAEYGEITHMNSPYDILAIKQRTTTTMYIFNASPHSSCWTSYSIVEYIFTL